MAIVDERGRIAGRVNLIDLFVALLIVVVIPVAYGAYLLFRTPTPILSSVSPSTLYQGPNLRIGITGKNLRPFMRVSFDAIQGRTFLIGSTTTADVDLPDLPPGSYDVALYDYAQEVGRLPKALTILPLAPQPTVELEVGGAFIGVNASTPIRAGQKFPSIGDALAEVVAVGSAVPADMRIRAGDVLLGVPLTGQVQRQATLRVKCYVAPNGDGSLRCMFPGTPAQAMVARDSTLSLPGPEGWINFQISDVHVTAVPPVARARVAFAVTPEILARIKVGQSDTSPRANARGYNARIASVDSVRTVAAQQILTANLEVPVEPTVGGWNYKQEPFKIGAPFSFETAEYVVHGQIVDMTLPASAAPTGNRGSR